MAEAPVPVDLLAERLNIGAIRNIIGKNENKEVTPFEVDKNIVLESTQMKIPKNALTTKMPKGFFENLIPDQSQTDKLWTSTDSKEDHSNGLSKSILSESEEREPDNSVYEAMRQINQKLDPSLVTETVKSNKPYPSSTPVNSPLNNGLKQPVSHNMGGLSEDMVRKIIKEEIYKVLGQIVDTEKKNRLTTEQIQVKVGNSIFSGNLKVLPSKLKKKK